ncbi:ATP-binding protein [Sphingomonas jaspsi]|uniref:ATP-binding protein n=1 Tax=Sphingomonas jaspsi TaxID=392409 RepID=UPI0004B879B8|nr:ATP-binding protein [Sphingomonas jaspsi]
MLLDKENRTIVTNGVQQVARATIKTSPKIFNFFADQTYANKPRAICRELAANALDSHVMAGKPDLPIEVWLPTLLDPVFRVRDHGLGMSHDFMMTSFMCYADGSTKDSSNEAIGGFGIGSKSPFAYVDQYTVTSRFDGVESAYSVFKDDDGIPAIGLLGQRVTDQPNGVEVSFPVKPEDFTTFEEAAFEALRYFEPLPEVKNAVGGGFTPPAYVSKGKTWGMRQNAGALNVIMGGILYPVSASNLTYKFPEDSAARKLLEYGLDLRLPIGTCSVALSREALSYDDRTIEAIRLACEAVIEEVAESFSTMFDHIDSPWEAAVALHNELGDNHYSARAKFLSEHAKWKGAKLETSLAFPMLAQRETSWGEKKLVDVSGFTVWEIDARRERRGRGGTIKQIGSAKFEYPGKHGFQPGRFAALVIDDLPQTPKHKAIKKIKEFADENGGRLMVIRPDVDVELTPAEIVAGMGYPPHDQVVLTSSLPEPVMERTYSKNLNRPKVRMFSYDGTTARGYDWRRNSNNINPGAYGKDGVEEIAYADQPETGILVVMETFNIPDDLREKVDSGLLRWSELSFVNSGDAKKLPKGNWTDYAVEFENRKKAELAKYPDLAARLAVSNSSLRWLFDFFRRHPGTDFTSKKPLGRIFSIYKTYVEPLDQHQLKLAQFVTAKLPGRIKPEELNTQFRSKQWKAARLLTALSHIMDEDDMRLFQENL